MILSLDHLAMGRAINQDWLVQRVQESFGHDLPRGVVTLLFSDIEGSTRLLQRLGDHYGDALMMHRRLLRGAFEERGGREVNTEGDGIFFAFPAARKAVEGAIEGQQRLAAYAWPDGVRVRVRMGLHTGEPGLVAGEYVGLDVHTAARICAAAHGGQILVSQSTRDLLAGDLVGGVGFRELGRHRLKDLPHPELLFQLVASGLPERFPPVRSLERPTNLPLAATPMVGRERQLTDVCALLRSDDVRLLTLTGPPGTGKTRLALQAAASLLAGFRDGVFFVPLASVSHPALVVQAVAQSLGVTEAGGRGLLEALQEYLRDRQLLLVLDNFEQLLDGASLVAELLGTAPGMKTLVTSRAILHLAAEHDYPVPPLELPDLTDRLDLQSVASAEAVVLFVQRARAAKHDFGLTEPNAAAVAAICVRLEGLPLAIELAAARVRLLPPEALLDRLQSRLALVTGGARDLPRRQQAIRNAIAWSYDLLSVEERTLFRWLCVFVGGFTLDAAEAICGAPGGETSSVLDGLASLVDKSLLRQGQEVGQPRFTMLETLREYGLERLAEHTEADVLRRRHAEFFVRRAEEAEPSLRGSAQVEVLQRLDAEYANFRAALDWAVGNGDAKLGLRVCGALWRFWQIRGLYREGREQVARVLAMPGATGRSAERAQAEACAGRLAFYQTDFEAASALLESALSIQREIGDKPGIAFSLLNLAMVARARGNHALARHLLEEGVATARAGGDRWILGLSLSYLGGVSHAAGDDDEARGFCEEALVLLRALGDLRLIGLTLLNLSLIARAQTDLSRARALLEEAVLILRELGDKGVLPTALIHLALIASEQDEHVTLRPVYEESLMIVREVGDRSGIAASLEGLAGVFAHEGDLQRAARLDGAASALWDATGAARSLEEEATYKQQLASVRHGLAEDAFVAAFAAGRELLPEQAVAEALQRRQP
jgi:predicted ATPase/class 3 adenylate cyclase